MLRPVRVSTEVGGGGIKLSLQVVHNVDTLNTDRGL